MEVKKGYKQTEVGMIPDDWDVASLSGVCRMKSGEGITSADIDEFSKYPCYGGNGLRGFTNRFTHDGQYALIGRQGALCGNVVGAEGKFFASEHAVVVTPFEQTDIHWLTYVLRDMRLNQYSESSAQPGLSVLKLLKLNIAFPSNKTEQRAIAAALSDVDSLLTALDALIAKKRLVKQGTMQELLKGKMRLLGFQGKGKKQTEVGLIPEDWDVGVLGDLAIKVGSGITPTGGEKVYKNEGRPFIRSQNVGWGTLLLDDIAFINEETHASFSATEIQLHDVLLNITGASIGRSAVADTRIERGNVNQHVCIIRTDKNKLIPHYINLFLLSKMGQKQIDSFQAGGNRQGLNFGQIKSFRFPLPPLPEQTAIAEILSDMDAEIATLKARREKTALLKQGMMQELLTGKIRLV